MSKLASGNQRTRPFILGRQSAEKISAVEGLVRTERSDRLLTLSDARSETGDVRRARIRAEFAKK